MEEKTVKHFNPLSRLPKKADDDLTFILLEVGNAVIILTGVLGFLRLVAKGPEAGQI